MHRPLADEIRPKSLDEVVGQRHLLAPGGVLRRLIDAGTDANMVFYGPSGTGKTTVANIIAERTNKTLYRLNATTSKGAVEVLCSYAEHNAPVCNIYAEKTHGAALTAAPFLSSNSKE